MYRSRRRNIGEYIARKIADDAWEQGPGKQGTSPPVILHLLPSAALLAILNLLQRLMK